VRPQAWYQVSIIFHDDALKTSMEKMAVALVEQIKIARIGGTEPLHGLGQIGLSGFQQKMIVIAHQHISVPINLKPFAQIAQEFQKPLTIIIRAKYLPAVITSR
jgi:hypothetical protein